jgi:hypothetical protein
MAYNVKYLIEYQNLLGDSYKLEILKQGTFAQELSLAGSVVHNFVEVQDIFSPIRASNLTIDIEASTTNLLLDFANFEEFDFKVKFYRNTEQIFEGWINPDGYFQDWVNDKWIISLQAVDGLGTLKNLEFSDVVPGGVPFKVKPREANYLYAIMERLGYFLPFTIGDDINNVFGVANEWTDFDKRIIDSDVFKNKNGNFLDCETVLKDILQKYNLCIQQQNIDGRLVWYIYRCYYGVLSESQRRNRQYNISTDSSEGLDNVEMVFSQFAFADGYPQNKIILSDINATPGSKFDAIHCNENQQITFEPALQNFRFQSNWLGLKDFFGTIDNDYELIQTDFPAFYFKDNERLFLRTTFGFVDDLIFETIEYDAPTNSNLNPVITFKFESYRLFDGNKFQNADRLRFLWGVLWIDDNADEFWYNASSGEWQTSQITNLQNSGFASQNFIPGVIENELTAELPFISSGKILIYIAAPYNVANGTDQWWIEVYDTSVKFSDPLLGIGKHHDAIQPTKRSTFLQDPVNVINSNEPNAIFTNNLYRIAKPPEIITGLVPMTQWKATNTPTYNDLLELTSIERVRVKQSPQRVFRGDIYGYIPYSSVINYNGINGLYHITNYRHDTATGVIQIVSRQLFNDEAVINHEKNYIFENETNVLIKEL